MKLAEYGIIPDRQWNHDPNLKDIDNKTVTDYLIKNKFLIPNEWYD